MPAPWSSSRARSSLYAAVAVLLGVSAHGAVPALPVLALLVVLVEAIFSGLRRHNPLVAAVTLVLIQAPLHAIFSVLDAHHGTAPAGTMLAAHALAALATALLLACADGPAERAARLLLPIRVLTSAPPCPPPRVRIVAAPRHRVFCRAPLLLRAAPRRGPPLLGTAAIG
ncbi:hypothetical protein [Pseudonocardia thermophila]|uniref:hypothetical protein n=1 Tax=Pseudonocardia thermophila TaxID=1848 RepID=UPI001161118B|nr:hypothetical protein [Pseudonocardia thermophila]